MPPTRFPTEAGKRALPVPARRLFALGTVPVAAGTGLDKQ